MSEESNGSGYVRVRNGDALHRGDTSQVGGRRQKLETVTTSEVPYKAAFHCRRRKNGGEKRATSRETNSGGK